MCNRKTRGIWGLHQQLLQQHWRIVLHVVVTVVVIFASPAGLVHGANLDLLAYRGFFLHREDGLEHLQGYCTPVSPETNDSPEEVLCEFGGAEILPPKSTTPEEKQAALAKLDQELSSTKEPLKEFKELCQALSTDVQSLNEEKLGDDPRAEAAKRAAARFKAICARKPKTTAEATAAARDAMIAASEEEEQGEKRICRVRLQQWNVKFHRISGNKWVSNPTSPTFMCSQVKVYLLEPSGPFPGLGVDWTLTETPISVNSDQCKDIAQELMKPTRWTEKSSLYKLPCTYIAWRP